MLAKLRQDKAEQTGNAIPGSRQVALIKRVTWIGVVANLCLAVLKLLAGYLGGSQAAMADGTHSLSDMATDFAVLFGVSYWSQPADEAHPYGHRRLETLVSLSIAAVLAAVAAGTAWRAVATLHERHADTPEWIAFAAIMFSVPCKELLYRMTMAAAKASRSAALAANAWHHRSDALSSLPAGLSVAVAVVMPGWVFVDHVGALVVALLILQAAWKIGRPAWGQIMDEGATQDTRERILSLAAGVPGVAEAHELRTRYLGPSALSVDLHVLVDGRMSVRAGHEISERVHRRLVDACPEVMDVVVHLEPLERESGPGAARKEKTTTSRAF